MPGHLEDPGKRDFLKLVTVAGAAVMVGSIAWPLIDSMNPSADVLAVSSTDVDLTPITEGWRSPCCGAASRFSCGIARPRRSSRRRT